MYNINIKWYNYTVIPNIQLSTSVMYNYTAIHYTFYQLYTLYWLFHKYILSIIIIQYSWYYNNSKQIPMVYKV